MRVWGDGSSPWPGLWLMASSGWVRSSACADHERPLRDRNASVICRRAVLLAGAGLAARPAGATLPVPRSTALAFRLVRRGSEIGRHIVTFESQDDTLIVRVAVQALVTVFSIPIVRYSHHVVETWQGGTLVSLTGETHKNSDIQWVNARRTSEGLEVTGSKTERYIAPEPAFGTTYWNRHMVDGPIISLEDGVLLRPQVQLSRAETVLLASGDTIEADHYNLSGAFDIDVWYDQTDTWAGLAFPAPDGSTVHYERL